MGVVSSKVTQTGQIDKRAILAVIRAVVYSKDPTLVTEYRKVKFYLLLSFADDNLYVDDIEYKKAEEELYSALVNRRLKYVYLIYKDSEDRNSDLVLISPIELSEEQLRKLSEEAAILGMHTSYIRLNDYIRLYSEVTDMINYTVMWMAKKTSAVESLVDAVTSLVKEYDLDVKDVKYVYDLFCIKYGVCKEVSKA